MPAGAVGTSWATGSWLETVWEAFSWADLGTGGVVLVGSINDRMKTYLEAQHIPGIFASADFATLLQYDLSIRTGDYTARFQALIVDASA